MKAIIGTDGSACAQVALDLAGALPWPKGSTLAVVAALDPASFYGPFVGFVADVGDLETELETALGQHVSEAATKLAAEGRTVEHQVAVGRASSVVCDAATGLGADLIVVGSRGHGPITSMLLGSVSAEVVDHANRPVLVVRDRTAGHVLLATDGSDNGRAAEDLIATMPILAGARVDVVSVAERSQDWDGLLAADVTMPAEWWVGIDREAREHHEQLAADASRRLVQAGHASEPITPGGDAAHEIVRTAQEHGVDLIVIGTRGNTGLRRLVLGSVARNVLLHAHCSVLVVPPAAA